MAVISLRRPADGRWYGFSSRTTMQGAISAFLRYNLLYGLLTELVNNLPGSFNLLL